MFEIFKNVILGKNYKLEDMLNKINVLWLESKLSDEEKTSLITLARDNAVAENSYASNEVIFKEIFTRLEKIENIVFKDDEEEVEEYPPFVKPEGAHDCYNEGDKITYNEKKYICKINGCVWSPDEYPAGWQEVVEETENTETEVVDNE